MAWYPLNGDYKNYTAENMELTQTSTPSYENGKIGKALNLGGFKWTAEQTAKILNNKEVSIALWIYVNADEGSTTNRAMIFGNDNLFPPNNRRFSLYQYPNCNSLHWSWQNGNSSESFTAGVLNGVLPSYKWTHICVTYKNPIGKIYINGELKRTFNGVYNAESFEYETQVIHNSPYHYLNDYRFYDHCLSDVEIKEISKGLILHYTMDNIYGGSNLLLGSDRFSGAGGNASGITSSITENGELKVIASKGNGNWKTFAMSNKNGTIESIQNNMSVGDEFVISFDMKIESGSGIPTLFLNAGNIYERMIGNPNLIGKWQRVYKVRTWKEPRNIIWLFKFVFGI